MRAELVLKEIRASQLCKDKWANIEEIPEDLKYNKYDGLSNHPHTSSFQMSRVLKQQEKSISSCIQLTPNEDLAETLQARKAE